MRTGQKANPTLAHLTAIPTLAHLTAVARSFAVPPAYCFEDGLTERAAGGPAGLAALRDHQFTGPTANGACPRWGPCALSKSATG